MTIELVILNYNGIVHLTHLLPSALTEVSCVPNATVTVLDNRSTKNDEHWVTTNYPDVKFVHAPSNDYLFSYNWYAEESRADILIFLNNDLKLKPNFIRPLVSHFEDSEVFSVSATSRDWNDTEYTFGLMQLNHHHGMWYAHPDFNIQKSSPTLFTSGGFMALDRLKFLNLKGFDKIFYPAYGEDLDICFRAWMKGWKCIYEPKSIVLHRENASWINEGKTHMLFLQQRAWLLFVIKYLPSPCSFLEKHVFLFLQLIKSIFLNDRVFFNAWVSAHRIKRRHSKIFISEKVSLDFIKKLGSCTINMGI